jgi:hypothetical protein
MERPMIIKIDEKELDITLENEETVGDVVLAVEKWLESGDLFVSGIKIDGQTVASGAINEVFKQKIAKITLIELKTANKKELFDEAVAKFTDLEAGLADLLARLSDFSVDMQTGAEEKASDTVRYFSDFSAELLLVAGELFSGLENASENTPASNTITKVSAFCTILKDFFAAYENNDMVLTGDLCEYEVRPALADIFSSIKNYLEGKKIKLCC